MKEAIGVMEFSSIARGMLTADRMMKAARIRLLKAATVCPGKYILLFAGQVDDVSTAIRLGKQVGGEYVVDELELPHVHAQVIPAILQISEIGRTEAVGVMEFYSVTSGIQAADIAAKAAAVQLLEIRIGYAVGGKGLVLLTGDLEAVKTALEAAGKNQEFLLQRSLIARPEAEFLQNLY